MRAKSSVRRSAAARHAAELSSPNASRENAFAFRNGTFPNGEWAIHGFFGGSSSGRTTVSDTVYLGSNPSPPAKPGPTMGPFLTKREAKLSERNSGGRLA